VIVPKGKGALKRLRLRPWQTDLVASVLDPDPPPSLAGWMLPRGQGKSALVAALELRSLQILAADGLPVLEFPQSTSTAPVGSTSPFARSWRTASPPPLSPARSSTGTTGRPEPATPRVRVDE
jgi:hypothetical protein